MSKETKLTSNAGAPVGDNPNVTTAGPRGPFRRSRGDGAVRVDGNHCSTPG
jgi:hypothetical protein